MSNFMKKVGRATFLAIPALALLTVVAQAQEEFSGNLLLRNTLMRTHNTILALPKAPNAVDAFTPTYVYCFPGAPCVLEITMTSELSDVSAGTDSLRFLATVDGSPMDVFPTTNLGINSTAKAGQMENGTGTWMRKNLAAGWHLVRLSATVNDTNGDGIVSGYIGDRSMVIRVYSNQY